MTDEIQRDPVIEESRTRLEQVAAKLCTRMDPLDVGGTFLAIGTALVTGVMGRSGAGRYLRDLAAELDGDDDPSWGGGMKPPAPAAGLLASTADLLATLAAFTADPRFFHAAGILRGRRGGRPAVDDGPALGLAESLLAGRLVRSKNHACKRAAAMYSATNAEVEATRARLVRKLRRK